MSPRLNGRKVLLMAAIGVSLTLGYFVIAQGPGPRTDYCVGLNPSSVATGDFDGDGLPDLVVTNSRSNNVTILLATGARTFTVVDPPFRVGLRPSSVAVGNFDMREGRTILDLAVANLGSGNISILIGNGDGTFQPPRNILLGSRGRPTAIVAADFNGDGALDLVVADRGLNYVFLLLGRGDGTFGPLQPIALANRPSALAVGDFDGDGNLDLAVANEGSGTVSILLGQGDGTFRRAQDVRVQQAPRSIAVGTFDTGGGRTILDLAVANFASGSVSILIGNGDGTFQPARNIQLGQRGATSIAAGTLDPREGRTILDLAVVNMSSDTISILRGTGDGTFGPFPFYIMRDFREPTSILVGPTNPKGQQPYLAITGLKLANRPCVTSAGATLSDGPAQLGKADRSGAGINQPEADQSGAGAAQSGVVTVPPDCYPPPCP